MAQISKAQMAKLFLRMAGSYSAGIDLRSAFDRESQHGSPSLRRNLKKVVADLHQGRALADSFQSLDGYFPPLTVSVVRAGERGGRLEDSFRRLGEHYDNLVKFRNRFLLSIAWPIFELIMAVVVVGLLILILGWIFESNGMEPIDWFGMGLSNGQNFFLYVFLVLVVASGFGTLIFGTFKGWFGTLPMRIARRLPLIGKTIESLALSRFAWTMSIAENAGMSAVETVQLACQATQNYYYTRLEEPIATRIGNGNEFYPTFLETGAFPTDFLMYVSNGEASGQLAESMDRVSKVLIDSAENNLKMISVIGFVVCLLFVAVLIGFTVITLYQTLYIDKLQEFSL